MAGDRELASRNFEAVTWAGGVESSATVAWDEVGVSRDMVIALRLRTAGSIFVFLYNAKNRI